MRFMCRLNVVTTSGKDGVERVYETHLLRRSFREDGKVRNETVANLSHCRPRRSRVLRLSLAGKTLVEAGTDITITRSVPHGHVAAVWAMAQQLGLPALLGPAGRMRDLALALIISRAVAPASKLATITAWDDITLGADLAVAGASTDEVYAALDHLLTRQDVIEKKLAATYLGPKVNPSRMALYDLSSSWMTGTHCPLAKRGYSRDGKKNLPQIEYAVLTDPAGCPVAVRVFEGNTADPTAFTAAVTAVKDTFALENMVMVGDRGMITTARIRALKQVGGLGWLTALRAPQIAALAADTGPLQMSLFDEQNFAEITHPDYPGERLIACRNPALADLRARKRTEMLDATETAVAPILAAVTAGRLIGADKIGLRVGQGPGPVQDGETLPAHHHRHHPGITRDQQNIDAETALDGLYVLRTTIPGDEVDTAGVIGAYKNLANVEKNFRPSRPSTSTCAPSGTTSSTGSEPTCSCVSWPRTSPGTSAGPSPNSPTPTKTHPPEQIPSHPPSEAKPRNRKQPPEPAPTGYPCTPTKACSPTSATLTRNDVQYGTNGPTVPTLAEPTPVQRRVFQLLGAPIPTTLT